MKKLLSFLFVLLFAFQVEALPLPSSPQPPATNSGAGLDNVNSLTGFVNTLYYYLVGLGNGLGSSSNGQALVNNNGAISGAPLFQNLVTNRAPQYNDDSTKLIDSTHGLNWKDQAGQLWVNTVNTASHAVWNLLGAPSQSAYPCDVAGGCYTAYGVKQMVGNYTGPAFQVKRASDSTTHDIGFLNGVADFATADNFCANTTCTIPIFYNQTSNSGHNCVPYQTAAQPSYPTFSTTGTRAFVFDGTYQQGIGASYSKSCADSSFSVSSQAFSMFFVGTPTNVTQTQVLAGTAGQFFLQLNNLYYWYAVASSGYNAAVGSYTSNPNVFGVTSSASTVKVYNDDRGPPTNGGFSSSTITPITYFNNTSNESSYSGFNGSIWAWVTFNSALAAATVTSLEQSLYAMFPVTPQIRNQMDFIGDSLTAGYAAQYGLTVAEQLRKILPNPVRMVNVGQSGQYCSYFASGGTGATNGYQNVFANGSKNTIMLWCGTNDLVAGGYTPAQAYANLQGAINYIRATDATDPLLVLTMIDRANGTYQTNRAQFNADIRAGFTSGTNGTTCSNPSVCTAQSITAICTAGANCQGNIYLVDVGADPLLGQSGNSSNTTYFYSDQIHITNLGQNIVAQNVKATLDTYGIVP